MKKYFADEQIMGFWKEAPAGTPIKELRRKHGFSGASFSLRRQRSGRHGCGGHGTVHKRLRMRMRG
jgi:hypothetical protein